MNKNRQTSHLTNVLSFDLDGNIILLHTPSGTDNSTRIPTTSWVRTYVTGLTYATESYVSTQITNLIDAAPGALDTLNELAAALGDDPNFATTITNSLATKLALTGGTLTGGLYINPTNTSVVGLDVASNTITFRSDNLEGFKRQLTTTLSSGTLVKMQAAGYGGTYVTDLGFYTSSNSAVNTLPNIYLTGGNNYVGINTVAPEYNLDVTGTGRYTSTLIAASFVKSGGTSAQFLMANGSVSTNPGWLTGITSSQVTTALGYTPVTNARTITINGTAYDLSADRSWSIASGVTSFNTRTGAITLSSGDVTGALGYTPYNSSNPSGYITSSGSISGNAATATTATNSSQLNGLSSTQLFNNMGNNHGTYTNANDVGGFGFRYLQGSTNSPNTGATQYYGVTVGLGNEYAWGTYGSQFYWNRTSTGGNPYVSVRFQEGGSWTSWSKIYAGYADSAGSATDSSKLPLAGGTLTGSVTVNGGYSFVAGGYNNNGGFAMNNGGQYWGLMWNYSTNDWRLGRGSQTAQNGWNLRWDSGDNVFINQHLYLNNNYGSTIVGAYSSTRYQGVFAMGDAYKLPLDGTSTGSLYGLAWSHPNAGGVASNLNTHGLLVMENGTFLAAISGSIRARDDVRAPALYDSGSRVAISRGEGRNFVDYSRYVYNNGAYSGSGWIEPSDLGVRYAASAGYASSAGSATDSSKLPLSGGTINGNLTVYGNYATSGEIYTGYQFKCGSGSDTPYLNNPYGADHWRAAGSAWFTYGPVGSTNFFSTSRRSVKTQIESFSRSALDLINTVAVVEYRYKNDLNNKRIGFIAEDTIEELATQSHDQMDLNSSIGLLIKAVQELSLENKELRNELTLLKTT